MMRIFLFPLIILGSSKVCINLTWCKFPAPDGEPFSDYFALSLIFQADTTQGVTNSLFKAYDVTTIPALNREFVQNHHGQPVVYQKNAFRRTKVG